MGTYLVPYIESFELLLWSLVLISTPVIYVATVYFLNRIGFMLQTWCISYLYKTQLKIRVARFLLAFLG